jgi:hypothetical protein
MVADVFVPTKVVMLCAGRFAEKEPDLLEKGSSSNRICWQEKHKIIPCRPFSSRQEKDQDDPDDPDDPERAKEAYTLA